MAEGGDEEAIHQNVEFNIVVVAIASGNCQGNLIYYVKEEK